MPSQLDLDMIEVEWIELQEKQRRPFSPRAWWKQRSSKQRQIILATFALVFFCWTLYNTVQYNFGFDAPAYHSIQDKDDLHSGTIK